VAGLEHYVIIYKNYLAKPILLILTLLISIERNCLRIIAETVKKFQILF